MAGLAIALHRALDAAGVPITGVSIGDELDRRTWKVVYRNPTPQEFAAGEAIKAAFDLADPDVKAREQAYAAQQQVSVTVRAFYLFWFRKTYGKDPTAEEKAADMAALLDAFTVVTAG